jgi:predicted methyltransferase
MKSTIRTALILITATLALAGCSRDDAGSETAATGGATPARAYQDAVADQRRPAEDRQRDAGRKPAEVLRFFGIAPGQTVLDISSGGGYFTRIISGVVGSEGEVIANNSGSRVDDAFKKQMEDQYADYDNVELNYENPEDISLPDNSLDAVLLSLSVHHWHYDEDSGEFIPDIALERYDNIMRMLKPGGVFAVIDHAAAPGMSRQASDEIHRIPEEIAEMDITLAGFVLDAKSDIHANNPGDDTTARWDRDPRDATVRLVHRYVKPAG